MPLLNDPYQLPQPTHRAVYVNNDHIWVDNIDDAERRNHFSYDGTQLLKERAKTIRPGMILQIDDDDTTDDPPTTDTQNSLNLMALLGETPHQESLNLSGNNLGCNALTTLLAASSSLSNLKELE
eukprot:Em0001g2553a